jgi:hypothetical protein
MWVARLKDGRMIYQREGVKLRDIDPRKISSVSLIYGGMSYELSQDNYDTYEFGLIHAMVGDVTKKVGEQIMARTSDYTMILSVYDGGYHAQQLIPYQT